MDADYFQNMYLQKKKSSYIIQITFMYRFTFNNYKQIRVKQSLYIKIRYTKSI